MSSGAVCSWENTPSELKAWESHEEDLELAEEIDRVASLIENDDYDEDGTGSHSIETLSRAAMFLTIQATELKELCEISAPVPSIDLGPKGSIDLHWKRRNWELLVNIPADASKRAAYYGNDYGSQDSKGSFDPKTFNYGIAMWLTKD